MLYRCTRKTPCGARRALRKPIDEYVRRPMCPGCGRDTLKLDVHQTQKNKESMHRCSGLPFPHRKGSKWCNEYKGEYTEQDEQDYRDMIMKAAANSNGGAGW